jgi:3-deoxy-D-manno-octulosonic-acid transferase
LSAFFSAKARKWIEGRKDIFYKLNNELSGNESLIWIHAASLGEFEQGRPIIEAIRKNYSEKKILLTFFSPSGYEIRKDYDQVDIVCYLPLDTSENARRFVEIVNPDLVLFIKYEIWFYFLKELTRRKIPVLLISAEFRQNQYFFKWYGKRFLALLKSLDQIFVQGEESAIVLRKHNFTNFRVSGDTRADRVMTIASERKDFSSLISAFSEPVRIIAGSTWEADEDVILPFIARKRLSCIIAPHEIDEPHLKSIEQMLKGTIRYSELKNSRESVDYVLVDTIGLLAYLYRLGAIAYVGGGFGSGIHNTLEPAAYGIPVVFGPKFQKFKEARDLIRFGGAFSVKNAREFSIIMDKLEDEDFYKQTSAIVSSYMKSQLGASKKIMRYIAENQGLGKYEGTSGSI